MLLDVIVFLNGAFGADDEPSPRGTVKELRREYGETVIVPMTVLRLAVWRELSSGFREADADLRAFRLTATATTLQARIVGRPESEGPHDWCLEHMSAALAALRDEEYGTEIQTDQQTPQEIGAAALGTL